MKFRLVGIFALYTISSIASACQDHPTMPAPTSDPLTSEPPRVNSSGTAPMILYPRFRVQLEVASARGGSGTIQIMASAMALVATDEVSFSVSAPDIDAVTRREEPRTLRPGEPVQALERRTTSLGEGEAVVLRHTLTVPGPGYYRIIALAQNDGEQHQLLNGQKLKDVGYQEAWVWIDGDHIEITREFEPTLFPLDLDPVPGPHRPRGWRADPGSLSLAVEGTPDAALMLPSSSANTAYISAVYYHVVAQMWLPIPNARMLIEYWDRDHYGNPVLIYSNVQQTDSQGRFQIDCQLSSYYSDDVVFAGTLDLRNEHVRALTGSTYFSDRNVGEACLDYQHGYEWLHDVQTWHGSHAFVMINTAITAISSSQLLGAARQRVDFRLNNEANGASSYDQTVDRITIHHDPDDPIDNSGVWGIPGGWELFVQSHEYGHAYHHGALGGWVASEFECPPVLSPHYMNGPHGMSCAYVEGFGNFIGAIGRPDLDDSTYPMRKRIAQNEFYPGWQYYSTDGPHWDGAMIEGAVAAFFYRTTHAAWLNYAGGWLAGIIQSCTVDGKRAMGVDHLIFCMEEQIDPAIASSLTYFQDRESHPSTWNHSAGRPQGWSIAAIRDRWMTDLYSAAP